MTGTWFGVLSIDVEDETPLQRLDVDRFLHRHIIGDDEVVPNARFQVVEAMRESVQEIVHLMGLD